jgi:hypothetical protein
LWEHFAFEMPQLVWFFMGVKICRISLNAFGQPLVSLALKGGGKYLLKAYHGNGCHH